MNSNTNTAIIITGGILAGEDKLDLSLMPVDPTTAATEISACDSDLEIYNRLVVTELAQISLSALDQMHTQAKALATSAPNYVTGIKLSFGANDSALILIYQPLFMGREASESPSPRYDVTEGTYFTYNPVTSSFDALDTVDAEAITAAYRENILIRHEEGQSLSPYAPGDTDACIYPFQTIYALLSDNEAGILVVHSSMRKLPDSSLKHCTLLSSEGEGPGTGSGIFKGKFANRSHLCPPSCNTVEYTLAKI